MERPMENATQIHTINLDGTLYAVDQLSPEAKQILVSLGFVEARLLQLQGEVAVSQTAHVAYARALKAELETLAARSEP